MPQVGVCHFPALGETFAAGSGLGCWWNGRRARVSSTATLAEAAVGCSDSRMLSERLGDGLRALHGAVHLLRGWGDCYGHCLVASGRLDAMIDPAMNPWDCCALVPILQEAGGAFTDWTGVARIDGGDAFSTNGTLHRDMRVLLEQSPRGRGQRFLRAGGWRLEAGGWRLEAGGWLGGWRAGCLSVTHGCHSSPSCHAVAPSTSRPPAPSPSSPSSVR